MKTYHYFLVVCSLVMTLASCGSYQKELKVLDNEYKYECAKEYFFRGQYSRSQALTSDVLAFMKGSLHGEESLFLLGLSTYGSRDYETAADYFRKYYRTYTRGRYAELARFYCGRALYENTLDPRLDQQATTKAIAEFNDFLEVCPNTTLKPAVHNMLMLLQDKLIEKEYGSAKLYYNLGSYLGNYTSGAASNYESCIVTCENALKDFPFASAERREEFSILILRARMHLARESVESRKLERYRATVDEYYAFVNDFPQSRYLSEATSIYERANKIVLNNGGYEDDTE